MVMACFKSCGRARGAGRMGPHGLPSPHARSGQARRFPFAATHFERRAVCNLDALEAIARSKPDDHAGPPASSLPLLGLTKTSDAAADCCWRYQSMLWGDCRKTGQEGPSKPQSGCKVELVAPHFTSLMPPLAAAAPRSASASTSVSSNARQRVVSDGPYYVSRAMGVRHPLALPIPRMGIESD